MRARARIWQCASAGACLRAQNYFLFYTVLRERKMANENNKLDAILFF